MATKGRAYELVGLGTTVEGEAGSARDGMVLEGFLKEETFELSLRSDKISRAQDPKQSSSLGGTYGIHQGIWRSCGWS